jgi:hypothetical protein
VVIFDDADVEAAAAGDRRGRLLQRRARTAPPRPGAGRTGRLHPTRGRAGRAGPGHPHRRARRRGRCSTAR